MKADSKENYIPLSTIYGKPNPDGTYTLTALDIKNLNDNLYAIAKKIQGGLTFADMTKGVNEDFENTKGDLTQVRVTAEGAAVTASAADGKATNAQITANGASVTASNALGKAQSVELTVDGLRVANESQSYTVIDGDSLESFNRSTTSKVAIQSGRIDLRTQGNMTVGSLYFDPNSSRIVLESNWFMPLIVSGGSNSVNVDGGAVYIEPSGILKLTAGSNMSIDANGTVFIGSNGGNVQIGNGGDIRLFGNVYINGEPHVPGGGGE